MHHEKGQEILPLSPCSRLFQNGNDTTNEEGGEGKLNGHAKHFGGCSQPRREMAAAPAKPDGPKVCSPSPSPPIEKCIQGEEEGGTLPNLVLLIEGSEFCVRMLRFHWRFQVFLQSSRHYMGCTEDNSHFEGQIPRPQLEGRALDIAHARAASSAAASARGQVASVRSFLFSVSSLIPTTLTSFSRKLPNLACLRLQGLNFQ